MVDRVAERVLANEAEASRRTSRCPSEEASPTTQSQLAQSGLMDGNVAMDSSTAPQLDDQRSLGNRAGVGPSSRSSSFHCATPPFELPIEAAGRLSRYLHDALCTSDDIGLMTETILHREFSKMRDVCMATFVSNPKYGNGKRPTLVAASQLDKFRQQVHDDRVENVPQALQSFSQELLKHHSKRQ